MQTNVTSKTKKCAHCGKRYPSSHLTEWYDGENGQICYRCNSEIEAEIARLIDKDKF